MKPKYTLLQDFSRSSTIGTSKIKTKTTKKQKTITLEIIKQMPHLSRLLEKNKEINLIFTLVE